MPSRAVSDAFIARLADWPNKAACPYVDLTEVSQVPQPPYLEIEWPVAVERRVGPGVRQIFREEGGARFVITVAALKTGAKDQALAWADELRDLFRDHVFDSEIVAGDASPPVLDPRAASGTKYRVPFVVLYQRDTIKG
jgi:hypothetical protein